VRTIPTHNFDAKKTKENELNDKPNVISSCGLKMEGHILFSSIEGTVSCKNCLKVMQRQNKK